MLKGFGGFWSFGDWFWVLMLRRTCKGLGSGYGYFHVDRYSGVMKVIFFTLVVFVDVEFLIAIAGMRAISQVFGGLVMGFFMLTDIVLWRGLCFLVGGVRG